MSSASNLNRLSSSSNGPHKNQTDPTTTTTNTSHLPKKPSLSSNNSSSINPHTNLLNTNPNSTSSPNPLHSKRTTPTLGGFPNLSSQSPSSPNSLGFGKSSFQTFGRIGDHSQPPSPGVFNNNSNNTNSNVKKAFQQLTQQQTTGNQTFQNNSTHRPRKLGSFNSLAANSTANNNTLSRGLAAGTKNNQEEKDSEENEIEDRSDNQRDPIHPTLDSSIPQHKLRAKWVFWLLHRPPSRKISEEEYGKAMKRLGSCDTVESFYSLYLHIKRPSNQQPVSDLHFFVDPIKPAWEDPLNVGGGKWTIRLKKGLSNRLWETLIFSLVGGGLEKLISNSDSESLDEKEDRENREICGAVLSIRRDEDILAVWHKTGSPEVGSDGKMAKQVKLSLQTVLQLPLNCHLAYKLNADCLSSSAPVNTNNNMQPNTYNQHQHHHNHHHHQQHQHQQGPLNKATGHHANHSLSHHHKQANRNSGLGHLGESKTGNTHSFSAGFGSLGSANGSATVTGDASVAEK